MPGVGQLTQERWAVGISFIVIELGLLGWLIYVIVAFLLNSILIYENLDVVNSAREYIRTHTTSALLPLILIIANRLISGIEAILRIKN